MNYHDIPGKTFAEFAWNRGRMEYMHETMRYINTVDDLLKSEL